MPVAAVAEPPRRNHVGTLSLLATVTGAVVCRVAETTGPVAGAPWLPVLSAGFEAGTIGGLADWFAVTALFRHPLGVPIPHTAIIPARRDKMIEGIVTMVEDEWLSPQVIGARLARLAPSAAVFDWLRETTHVARLGAPLRDVLRGVAGVLAEPEVVDFVERTLRRELNALPLDASVGRWLQRVVDSDRAVAVFETTARSLANVAARADTAATLQQWLDRTARQLHGEGKRLIPLILRRKVVQRKLVEAVCDHAAAELRHAAGDPSHPWRAGAFGTVRRFAERLAQGDPEALQQIEQVRAAVVDSLEAGPMVRDVLGHLRAQIEHDLDAPGGALSALVDRKVRDAILELLRDPARRDRFDQWVRNTVDDLLRRHHHEIGLTVREYLEGLDADTLVAQIEDRVGADLQYIRLNGAVVGGLIGVLLALLRVLTA